MNDPGDFEVCLCFHVPLRKLVKHYRLERPRVASQLSECHGAGTGCGFCVPFLESIFAQLESGAPPDIHLAAEEYARRRRTYHNRTGFDARSLDSLMPPVDLDENDLLDQIDDELKLE